MKYEWYKKGGALLDEIRNTELPDSFLSAWYVGQMGMVIKWNRLTVCFDPLFSDLCDETGNSRRNYASPFLPEAFRGLDYVVCSHNHSDHINTDTLIPLAEANPEIRVIVPEPEREDLIRRGFPAENLLGAKAGEEIILDGESPAILCPVAAAHEAYVTDENGNQRNLGYVLKCGRIHFYHSGDTVVTPQLIEDVRRLGPVHLACVPVNGLDTERHSRGIIGNMDCRDAAYFVSRIEADMTIPMHYDMVMGNEENPLIFAGYMRELYPGRKYHIMQLGERLLYSPV